MYDFVVMFDGYSDDQEEYMLANCSSTLLKGEKNIIVDTLTAWDGEKLKEALKENGLSCEDIDYVICTHGHSDHIGCNYLFPRARHMVGFSISHENRYYEHDFQNGLQYHIGDYIKVIPTPGHTLQDVSVIVQTKNSGIVAITGDLFEKEQDLYDDSIWKSAGSDCEELQIKNRKLILDIANWIVPGHGPMFKVPEPKISD